MTLRREVFQNGVLRERWDDDATPRTYTAWSSTGVQTSTRPYTPEENAVADIRAAEAAAEANRVAIEADLTAAITALRVIRDDSNPNINANPAARIKDLAKIDLSLVRLQLRRFDGTT
jgi:hypothetical protein